MYHLYVLVINTYHEWEDTVIFTREQEAIEVSLKYSNIRVDFFSKMGFRVILQHIIIIKMENL